MKRLSSIERTQLVTKLVNEFKVVFTNPFSAEGLTLQLKSVNCPYAAGIFYVLKKSNQLKKVEKGKYKFAFNEPIYYKAIQEELDKVVNSQLKYNSNCQNKKKCIIPSIDNVWLFKCS